MSEVPRPVLGLDLAAVKSGYAVLHAGEILAVGTITAPPAAGEKRTAEDNMHRLDVVTHMVEVLLDRYRPGLAVLEDYAPGAKGSAAHRLAEISGAVRLACRRRAVPLALVGVRQVKQYATGSGTAAKSTMAVALYKRTGLELSEDEVDAWWIAAMGADHLGHPPAVLPAAQRAVLDRITWPETGQGVIL
ncbi:crossover junction endodeoxyribonuclease RuvC [Nocardiopsis sp. CT-R113]|uniref:Crossover junction endodeoxyribonuclease RuvC n=1 Tax=Nocardiopsis codii TaxID=3065942 RepID=A0ABU7KG86_9ACTN|nr:crossover junction endodeoxyribonuclease RuvC [Nocardiopsis sp. CT-R113]MEE2041256.1 crossover junction endodeoxyribonuclease RuvC [Nocardiopsis sp. CT-R113]